MEEIQVILEFKLQLAEYISDLNREVLHDWIDFLLERNMTEFSGVFVIDANGIGTEIANK